MGVGYKFNFSDPFNFKSIDFSVSFTPNQWTNGSNDGEDKLSKNEQIHSSFSYSTTKFGGFLSGNYDFYASYNKANFYDLFGPTKRSRKGFNFGMDYNQSIIYDPPRQLDFDFGIGAYYGLDQSPEFQQINFSEEEYNTNIFYNLHTSLTFKDLKRSVGAVDSEKGINTSLNLSSSITEGKFYPKMYGNLDIGLQLPVNHTSLWLRNSLGSSFSNKYNPFTRFGFASFGNNYIDYLSAKMYRSTFSFPGVSYDSDKILIAKSFFKSMVELVLPPIRYRKLGFFNFFATYSNPSIFGGVLFSNDYNEYYSDPNIRESFSNIGIQLDTKLVMFSHLSATFSFGWARAFDNNVDNTSYDEWMISLKF